MKVLRAWVLNYLAGSACSRLSHRTAELRSPGIALADGRSYAFKACYKDLARQPLIDLSGSCADKSPPFENIPNLLCI